MAASLLAADSVRDLALLPKQKLTRVRPASKFMIDTGAGVIDADYRGTVHVLLFNLSDKDFEGASFSLERRVSRGSDA